MIHVLRTSGKVHLDHVIISSSMEYCLEVLINANIEYKKFMLHIRLSS